MNMCADRKHDVTNVCA